MVWTEWIGLQREPKRPLAELPLHHRLITARADTRAMLARGATHAPRSKGIFNARLHNRRELLHIVRFKHDRANIRIKHQKLHRLAALNLWGNALGPEGVAPLAESLQHNASLRKLNLWGNAMGSAGAQLLADALRVNSSLTHLDLQCNILGGDGVVALAEALRGNDSLQKLSLWGNRMGVDGARVIGEMLWYVRSAERRPCALHLALPTVLCVAA